VWISSFGPTPRVTCADQNTAFDPTRKADDVLPTLPGPELEHRGARDAPRDQGLEHRDVARQVRAGRVPRDRPDERLTSGGQRAIHLVVLAVRRDARGAGEAATAGVQRQAIEPGATLGRGRGTRSGRTPTLSANRQPLGGAQSRPTPGDLARIDAGRVAAAPEAADVAAPTAGVLPGVRPSAAASGTPNAVPPDRSRRRSWCCRRVRCGGAVVSR
jgi:hypothetical protein